MSRPEDSWGFTTHQCLAVEAEIQEENRPILVQVVSEDAAGGKIPDCQATVLAAGCESRAVGREGQGKNLTPWPLLQRRRRRAVHSQQADGPVTGSLCQYIAIR